MVNLDAQIKKVTSNIENQLLGFVRTVVVDGWDMVTSDVEATGDIGSPVYSGRFRGSHQIAVNGKDPSTLPPAPNRQRNFYNSPPRSKAETVLANIKLGDTINISNSLDYAGGIEDGTISSKTPRGVYLIARERLVQKYKDGMRLSQLGITRSINR
jgi:hypothetical protein